jgi:hemerythrin-like domain-containing protein
MLIPLGKRHQTLDAVDLLIECHGRIRRFLELATRLAQTRAESLDVVHATAGQIRRYFVEALPLHIADEDELVEQSLRGRSEIVDEALDKMSTEHVHHAPLVDRLVEVAAVIERQPARLEELAMELHDVAVLLQAAFEPHLAREESIIFPALRTVAAGELEAIKVGMRDRREAR